MAESQVIGTSGAALLSAESDLRARCLAAGMAPASWRYGLLRLSLGAKDTSRYRLQRFQQLEAEEHFCLERYYEAVPTFPSLFLRLSIQVGKRRVSAVLMQRQEAEAMLQQYRHNIKVGLDQGPPSPSQLRVLRQVLLS